MVGDDENGQTATADAFDVPRFVTTQPHQARGNRLIAHICNDLGGWGKRILLPIPKWWRVPKEVYRVWHKGRSKYDDFGLGTVQLVKVASHIELPTWSLSGG